MKHTTEELLLALAIHERVAQLRLAKTANMTEEEEAAFKALPVDALIKEAMAEIDSIATVISKIRASS
jgi:hypothetical protein